MKTTPKWSAMPLLLQRGGQSAEAQLAVHAEIGLVGYGLEELLLSDKSFVSIQLSVANVARRLTYHRLHPYNAYNQTSENHHDMSSPEKDTKKPKLRRDILERENVYFYEGVHRRKSLPEWLRPICWEMRFKHTKVPESSREIFVPELKAFECSGQDGTTASASGWSLKPYSSQGDYLIEKSFGKNKLAEEAKETLDDCLRVRDEALRLRESNVREPSWAKLLRSEFFKTYTEVYGIPNEHSNLFDRWELHADVLWNEFIPKKELTRHVRTGPKPDMTYSFPIIEPTFKMSSSHRFDPKVVNFTLPVLSELRRAREGGLISSPTSTLSKWDPKKPKAVGAADLTCFPWAIIEIKNGTWKRDKSEFCYCQAANASAEALIMREKLAERVKELKPSSDALVIFSFTCVGPSVRLWLTFRDDESQHIEMRCIWATSLELTWGVFALRTVIENMRKWVYASVKPEICSWITHVRSNPKPQTSLTPDGHQFEQRRRAKSLEPSHERVSDTPSTSRKLTPRSKIIPKLSKENTVPQRAHSPIPLSHRLAQLTIRIDELKNLVSDEDESDCERYASGSDDESYAPSDDATSDDDGFTTVEEETYDSSQDEDELDEGYSSDGS